MTVREHKIVVMGPLGAGKSTLVQTLTRGTAVVTEARNTDPTVGKQYTTVAMDYGDIDLPGGDRLRLYGSPGEPSPTAHRACPWSSASPDAAAPMIRYSRTGRTGCRTMRHTCRHCRWTHATWHRPSLRWTC